MSKNPERLMRGQIYFTVYFKDKNLEVPIVHMLRFDKRITDKHGDLYLFDDVDDGESQGFPPCEVNGSILDQDGLLQKLKDCFDGKLLTRPSTYSCIQVPALPEEFTVRKLSHHRYRLLPRDEKKKP